MPSEELIKEIEEAAEQVATEHAKELAQEQNPTVNGIEIVTNDTLEADASGETYVVDENQKKLVEDAREDSEENDTASEDTSTEDSEQDIKGEDVQVDTQDTSVEQDDEVSVPDLSDEIIGRAIRAGMSLTDVLAFPNEFALERVVIAAEQTQRSEPKDDTVKDPFAELELDPDKHEPEIIELFDKMKTALKGQQDQIQALGQEQAEVAHANKRKVEQEVTQWFDKQIEGLGEDFVNALGTGTYDSLDRGSPQLKNRDAIAEQTSILLAGYRAVGQEPPSRDEVFNQAARLVLTDEFQELHEKRLAGKLQKRAGQHIQRVGGTKAKKTETPEEETAALIDAKFS